MKPIRREIGIAPLLFLLLVLHSLPSLALQPLEMFLAGARERNPDELEARATVLEQQGQALSALGRVLPGVAANGSYTRNADLINARVQLRLSAGHSLLAAKAGNGRSIRLRRIS